MSDCPRIIGRAGAGLENAAWAVNADVARIGKAGELRSAAVLDQHALPHDGVTVLHDLRIPIPGFTANIDHVVVVGSTVHLLDSKVWAPGTYWTLAGVTRRGWKRVKHADKKTMEMAREALERYLAGRNVRAKFATPLLVVWPSSTRGSLSTRWMAPVGAKAIAGDQLASLAARRFKARGLWGAKPAEPNLVHALAQLVTALPVHRPAATPGIGVPEPTHLRATGTDSWW
ncbi:nuclease-related domain-containing protein [Nocardioides sp. InS609-2]|uniref:nuclease-related domain-containing protein n=1 Tax=Nocardioides sp. InS609-2 TaxID=2760705 RepID=UPI0020BFD2B3|nr:nuclease-related domain-containing protein [Nocardioides sp. InS609-2]